MNCPPDDVIEVSLIGPGYGESVVIHLGAGEWVVVDSCLDRTNAGRRGGSAALSYLQKIGVDPTRRVKAIICTHWHNDHIGGLADLVAACESADFFCPAALAQREFTAFAYVYAYPDPSPLTQATSEIVAVFEALRVQTTP